MKKAKTPMTIEERLKKAEEEEKDRKGRPKKRFGTMEDPVVRAMVWVNIKRRLRRLNAHAPDQAVGGASSATTEG